MMPNFIGRSRVTSLSKTPAARLQLVGELVPWVSFSPPVVLLGTVKAGEIGRPARIVATLQPELVAKPIPNKPSVSPSKPSLATSTSAPAESSPFGWSSSVPLSVSATVIGEIAAQPPLAAFGQVKRADAAIRTRRVLIQGKEETLAKLQVSVLSGAVQAKLLPAAPDKPGTRELEIVLASDAPEGLLQAKIIVAIQGTRTRLLLPASAFYSEPGDKSAVPTAKPK